MNDSLLIKFEENRKDFIKILAGNFVNCMKALAVWQYDKNKGDYEDLDDDIETENRNEIAKMKDKAVKYSSGTFLENPVFLKSIAKMEYDGEKVIDIIQALYKKYDKAEEYDKERYWWPMMYPIEKIIGKQIEGYCHPFKFVVVDWKNAGLFSKGVATLKYEMSPFVKDFVDSVLEIAKQDNTNISVEADAPSDDDPYSHNVVEIPFDQTFQIESKRIKGKDADKIWDLFVLEPNTITDRMKLFLNLKISIGELKRLLLENKK